MSIPTPTQQQNPPGRPQSLDDRRDGSGQDRTGGQSVPSTKPPLRHWPWWVSFLVLLGINYVLINLLAPPEGNRVQVSYTFFGQQVEANNVSEINSAPTPSRARSSKRSSTRPMRATRR